MKKKTKKLTYLTTGLMGVLAVSSIAGVALSSCTVTASGSLSGNEITLPDTWYSKDINWEDATSLNNLLMDKQGIVYSNKYMTEIIAIAPGYGGSTITIPASVKIISGYNKVTTSSSGGTTKTATGAFEGLTSLTNVVFAGKNVTQIGLRAFANCTSLQTIDLPSSVNIIGDSAFANCTTLSSINLSNIQYIGASAFNGAFTNIPYGSIDLNLIQTSFIGDSAFNGATGVRNFDLSKNTSLISIGANAFANCTYWNGAIDLSNDNYLSSIGNNAFEGCIGITNIYLSDITPLKTIGDSAFSGCTKLVSIGNISSTSGFIIPSTVSSIGTLAFANTLINSIDMSKTTATNPLKTSTFKDMPELASIDLGSKITTLPTLLFQNTPKLSEFDLVVPASVTSIQAGDGRNVGVDSFIQTAYSTFQDSGFRSIDLSNVSTTSTDIGYCFFQNCSNLQTVKLKPSITQIKFRAFYNCTSLKNVTFVSLDSSSTVADTVGFVAHPDLTTIGSFAFYNTGLESIDLSSVKTNILGDTNITETKVDNNTYRFANCWGLTTVKLPASTTLIPSYNFHNALKLSSVNFSELTKLTTIHNNNFYAASLTDIDLSNTQLTSLHHSNFSNLSTSPTVKLPPTLINFYGSNFTSSTPNTSGTGTTLKPLSVSYPNGYSFSSTTTNGILSSSSSTSSTSNSDFLPYLSRVSGELDFSQSTSLNGLGQNTLFGNSTITSLIFSSKTFATGTIGTKTNNNYLGFVGANINDQSNQNQSTYITSNLPLGNMSGLNTIIFKNFTNSSDNNSEESVIAKTTENTWKEVARIISSFSNNASNNGTDNINLSSWSNNYVTTSVNKNENNIVSSVDLKINENGQSTTTISDDSTSGTFTYEGVTWTIKVDSSNGTITITGTGINTYRAVVAGTDGNYSGTSYKVFFNTKSDTSSSDSTTVLPDSDITVTLTIDTNTSSSTPE